MAQRIALKLSSALVIIMIAGGVLMGIVVTQSGTGLLIEATTTRLSEEGKVAATHLLDIFDAAQRDLSFLSRSPSLRRVVSAYEGGDSTNDVGIEQTKHQLQEVFAALLVNHPWYTQARLIAADNNGMELVRVDRIDGSIRVVPERELQHKGKRDYVIESLAMAPDEFYWSAINLNREYGQLKKPYQPVVRVAYQVKRKNGSTFGIVIINLDARQVFDAARSVISHGLTLYIANRQGDYLYHPNSSKTFGFELGRRYRIQDDVTQATTLLEGRDDEVVVEEVLLPGGSEAVVAQLRMMHSRDDAGEDLLLCLTVPRTVIEQEVNAARRQAAALILPFLLVGTVLVFWLVRVFTAPLERVTREVSHFAPGVRRKRLTEEDRHDEVGMLAQAFSRMAERIEHQVDELEEQQLRYHSLFETAPDAIIIIDQDGSVEVINGAAKRLFGYSSHEIVGRNISMLMPEPERSQHDGYMQRYLEGGEARIIGIGREVTGTRKDGTNVQLYLSIGEFSLGGRRKFTGILHDISG